MQWRGPTELCFVADDHARTRIYRVTNVDKLDVDDIDCLTPGDVVVEALSFEKSGKLAALCLSTPKQMPDLHLFEEELPLRRLTDVNPQVAKWKTPSLSIVSWKASDGTTVEGVLELPFGAKPGEPLPLLVNIHGGPTWAVPYSLNYSWAGAMLFSSHGYAVLSPNYRGSTGYGDKFLTDLSAGKTTSRWKTSSSASGWWIGRIADPDRLGVFGWSNGGYLTNCVSRRRTRFKAASSGAGIARYPSWSGAPTTSRPIRLAFKQGYPWRSRTAYREASPMLRSSAK